jgi:hypothetical protein
MFGGVGFLVLRHGPLFAVLRLARSSCSLWKFLGLGNTECDVLPGSL